MTFTPIVSTGYLNMRVNYGPAATDAGYEGVVRVVLSGGTETVNGNVLNISNASSVLLLTRTAKYYSTARTNGTSNFFRVNWRRFQPTTTRF